MGKHKTTPVQCSCCGIDFEARNSDIRRGQGLFCSRSCKSSRSFNPNFKGGQLSNYEYKLRAMEKNPLRFHAMQQVQTAVRNGSLKKQPCAVCNSLYVEAHHHDYTKPIDVVWLCRDHHVQIHHG